MLHWRIICLSNLRMHFLAWRAFPHKLIKQQVVYRVYRILLIPSLYTSYSVFASLSVQTNIRVQCECKHTQCVCVGGWNRPTGAKCDGRPDKDLKVTNCHLSAGPGAPQVPLQPRQPLAVTNRPNFHLFTYLLCRPENTCCAPTHKSLSR